MNKQKILLANTLFTVTLCIAQISQAESSLTGNIGVTTNYMWRGITKSDDRAAVSSGLDYAHSSGWYIGIWTSSLDGSNSEGNYELNLYTGYGLNAGPVDFDFGFINYRFPVSWEDADFAEVYIKASIKNFEIGVYNTILKEEELKKDKLYLYDDDYFYLSAAFEVRKDLYLDLLIGHNNFDDPTIMDYNHGVIGLRKNDFTFTFQKNDLDGIDGDTRWSGSWRKEFDL